MRRAVEHIAKRLRHISCVFFWMLVISMYSWSQDSLKVYTIKNGKMYIWLSKKLPVAELDSFITQYDLHKLALKRFINSGNDDSIRLSGWKIGLNTSSSFTLSKPLLSSDDLNNPADRIIFAGKDPRVDAMFPSVSNTVAFGYNRFRNKQAFAIRDSVVTFFLRNNFKAEKVMLAGSFNKWDPGILPMKKTDSGWIADHEFNSVIAIGKPYIFKLNGYSNATKIALYGSFNNWRSDELFMNKTATGWELPYVLGPGNYEYKFVVDGKSIPDPANLPSANTSDRNNSILVLDPNYTFHLKGYETAKTVFLAGDFNDWNPNSMAMKKEDDGWFFRVHLSRGKHLYKFLVDGKWIIDPANKLWEQNQYGTGNSVLWVEK